MNFSISPGGSAVSSFETRCFPLPGEGGLAFSGFRFWMQRFKKG